MSANAAQNSSWEVGNTLHHELASKPSKFLPDTVTEHNTVRMFIHCL